MSNESQIVDALSSAGALCDDCLTTAIGWNNRQQAYNVGSKIAAKGVIVRSRRFCPACGKVKIVNSLPGDDSVGPSSVTPAASPLAQVKQAPMPGAVGEQPWHWEGHVQSALVAHLSATGWRVTQVVDTASKSPGVDVTAWRNGAELWVTVKGFPKGTEKTNPSTQGRHWFSHAMFDVVRYRTKRPDIDIGVALPDGFTTYLNLAPTVEWLHTSAPFTFFWVGKSGTVREE